MRLIFSFTMLALFAVSTCCGQIDATGESADASGLASSLKEAPTPSQSAPKRSPGMPNIRSADESIRQKLQQLCNWDYEQTPWCEIEKQLEKSLKINIVLTSSAKDDSLTDDEPISEKLTGVSTKNALRIMLQKKNATYIVKNGVMMIISLDDAEDERYFSTVLINVRPLLASIQSLETGRIGQPRITPTSRTTRAEGQINAVELVTAESLLIDLVHSSYQQDGWKQTGQGLATINILGGFAVVNCTEEFTDGLRDFLSDLDHHLSQD